MNEKNETCVQRTILCFSFPQISTLQDGGKRNLFFKFSARKSGPDRVRELKRLLGLSLERTARMMDILLAAHDDWAVTEQKDSFRMETVSLDFHEVERLLAENNFSQEEYTLEVEYTRKWGVL